MSETINSNQNNLYNVPNFMGTSSDAHNPDLNIQAHYSNSMKVQRKRRIVNDIPQNMPGSHLITPKDLDLKMRNIDNDLYEGAKKEKSKHDFNSKLYFEIFAGVTVISAIIACIRKFRK